MQSEQEFYRCLTSDAAALALQRIQEIFVDCSRYEMRFWDLSWRAGS